MAFRITILCENSVGPISGTLGEHGFAALVEHPAGSLLFDTGQGATLLHNARRLNRQLEQVEAVVLSHGHYDHTGGLVPLLEHTGPKTVFAHPGVFASRFRIKDTGDAISIGITATEDELTRVGARFQLATDCRWVAPQIALTGQVPRETVFETGDRGLFADRLGQNPDTVPDDQSLIIQSPKGLVLLLGCCHSGVINTIEAACRQTGVDTVYAIVGGTHLGFCGPEQLEQTIVALRGYGVKRICTSHCTGFKGAARLLREFPAQFQPAAVGYTLEV